MSEHVVVTGAAGYVGRHVVRALLDRGVRVTAVVRSTRAYRVDERARIVEADVLADDLDLAAIVDGGVDRVVHLAWESGFAHDAPVHMLHVSRHYALLRAFAEAGASTIAALGTMHEIGYHEGAIDETTPTNPTSLYGVAKDALRRATLRSLGAETRVLWLRAFYILGDDRNNQSVFTKLLAAAESGARTFPFTTGTNAFDFLDVRELAEQIAAATLQDDEDGIVNVCSGEPVALRTQVERFIADNGLDIELQVGAFPDRPYDSPRTWGDPTRIRRILERDAATS